MVKALRNLLVGWLGALLIRIIGPTLRLEIQDDSGLTENPYSPTPVIFTFWHNRMFLMPYLHHRFFRNRETVCLISMSQDGEMIARVLAYFKLDAVRGSSSRGGKEAYRELVERLKEGWDIAITPDGPRGPRYHAHDGVVSLAAFSGCPIIPVTYRVEWKIELATWDRFIVPLPFSKGFVHFGKAMQIVGKEGDGSEKAHESVRQSLESILRTLGFDEPSLPSVPVEKSEKTIDSV